jgi:hypothetical protein
MGLFKKNDAIKEIETCIVKENMWNIFTKVPWRVVDLRQGWLRRRWSKLGMPLIELVWIALDEVWEEKYLQYAWLFKDGAEIEDGSRKLLTGDGFNGFIYNGVKCKHIIIPSWGCNEFGCKALMLRSPDDAIKRLWYLYEKHKAKKIKST